MSHPILLIPRPKPLSLVVPPTEDSRNVLEKVLGKIGTMSLVEIRDELHITTSRACAATEVLLQLGLVTKRFEGGHEVIGLVPRSPIY